MLSFSQSVRAVRKSRPPSGRRPGPYGGGRGSFSRDESRGLDALTDRVTVDDAAAFLEREAKEKLRQDPSWDVVKCINALARTQQWSAEGGAAAARRVIAWASSFAGGEMAPRLRRA